MDDEDAFDAAGCMEAENMAVENLLKLVYGPRDVQPNWR